MKYISFETAIQTLCAAVFFPREFKCYREIIKNARECKFKWFCNGVYCMSYMGKYSIYLYPHKKKAHMIIGINDFFTYRFPKLSEKLYNSLITHAINRMNNN